MKILDNYEILTSYINSIKQALETDSTFINCLDLEINELAKRTLNLEFGLSCVVVLMQVNRILSERNYNDVTYTQKHIQVCKAMKEELLKAKNLVEELITKDLSLAPSDEECD